MSEIRFAGHNLNKNMFNDNNKVLILENIRSAHNVGAIFRTASGAGVGKIFLVGYTPTPLDRFNRPQQTIKKTALGAEQEIPWEYDSEIEAIIFKLKRQSYKIVSVEQTSTSVSLENFCTPQKAVFILGNEVSGVTDKALGLSDYITQIPMLGKKESLNVATAMALVVYHDLLCKK